MKSFILVGDVMKSIDLLQFQQDYRTIAVISRDPRPLEVYSVEFIIDNANLAFAVTDADKNLTVYMYQVRFFFRFTNSFTMFGFDRGDFFSYFLSHWWAWV